MTQFSVPWQPKRDHAYRGLSRVIVSAARSTYAFAAPIISRFPGAILLSAIAAVCLVVWCHALVYGYGLVMIGSGFMAVTIVALAWRWWETRRVTRE